MEIQAKGREGRGFDLQLALGRWPKLTWMFALLTTTILLAECLFALGLEVEDKPKSNPLAGNSAAIQEGASLFRAHCSRCHGLNATGGGRGPDLTANRWTHGSSDSDVFSTITQGVPGTEMPASRLEPPKSGLS